MNYYIVWLQILGFINSLIIGLVLDIDIILSHSTLACGN